MKKLLFIALAALMVIGSSARFSKAFACGAGDYDSGRQQMQSDTDRGYAPDTDQGWSSAPDTDQGSSQYDRSSADDVAPPTM